MATLNIFGTLGFDIIRKEKKIGGSGIYSALASALFSATKLFSIVGSDFPLDKIKNIPALDIRNIQVTQKSKSFSLFGEIDNQGEVIKSIIRSKIFKYFSTNKIKKIKKSLVFIETLNPFLQLKIIQKIKADNWLALDTQHYWIKKHKLIIRNQLIKNCQVFLINERELSLLFNSPNLKRIVKLMLKKYNDLELLVLKRGERGVWIISKSYFLRVPAFKVKPSNTIGAGDVFGGAFLGYLNKLGFKKNLGNPKIIAEAGSYASSLTSLFLEEPEIKTLMKINKKKLYSRFKLIKNMIESNQS